MGAIKCLKCGTVLESLYRHDFQMCDCDNQTFVDGGTDYMRLGGMDMDYVEVLESCEKCGCRLDDKPTVLFAHESKGWTVCEKCYGRMKGGNK